MPPCCADWACSSGMHSDSNFGHKLHCRTRSLLKLGFPFSYGVFQEYYSTHAPFSPEPSGIAAIGSSAMVSSKSLDNLCAADTLRVSCTLDHHLSLPYSKSGQLSVDGVLWRGYLLLSLVLYSPLLPTRSGILLRHKALYTLLAAVCSTPQLFCSWMSGLCGGKVSPSVLCGFVGSTQLLMDTTRANVS